MSQSSVHIVARLTAKPEAIAALRAVLETLLTPTRQEAGCHRYALLQNRHDPTDFTFIEEWADDAVIDQHMQSAHLKKALVEAAGLLAARPDIQRYDLIG